jgi:hypothetical protein
MLPVFGIQKDKQFLAKPDNDSKGKVINSKLYTVDKVFKHEEPSFQKNFRPGYSSLNNKSEYFVRIKFYISKCPLMNQQENS